MMKGVTKSGFAFEIQEEVLDDMELLDAICEIEENPLMVSKVLKMLLGNEQRKALYDNLRNEAGRVPASAVSEAIADIFFSCGQQGKN